MTYMKHRTHQKQTLRKTLSHGLNGSSVARTKPEKMRKLNLEDWVTMQRRRKWRFAQKVFTSDPFEWTNTAFHWDPTLDPQLHAHRRTGRPKTRWMDDLKHHIDINAGTDTNSKDNLHQVATNREQWQAWTYF